MLTTLADIVAVQGREPDETAVARLRAEVARGVARGHTTVTGDLSATVDHLAAGERRDPAWQLVAAPRPRRT